ncbi:MAG: ATP-binding protein [Pedosphaera sp.]|nr:ATP-binding protein [Pedosphaera sp.]
MLNRNRSLRRAAENISEEITPAPGETKAARFKTWLAEKLAVPRYCATHPHTRLVFERSDKGGIFKVYEELRYGYDPHERPGVFDFRAALRCPACRCAYALCPPESHTTSFETFDTSTPERANALARCREFAAQVNTQRCGFALLVGKSGNGKTRLACNVVSELDNGDALYVRQGQLTLALRATYGRKDVFLHRRHDEAGDDEPPTPLEIVQVVRFLVLDEIGCKSLANDELLFFDELLKHRYDEQKPTILISNLALDQLKEFLGDALTDRIKHATGNGKFILQFEGDSYRRTTGENYLEGLR